MIAYYNQIQNDNLKSNTNKNSNIVFSKVNRNIKIINEPFVKNKNNNVPQNVKKDLYIHSSSEPTILNHTNSNYKPRRTRTSKILYPIFKECSSKIDDPFWKTTFIQCSCGKFPRGIKLKDNFLIFKKNKKIQQIELSTNLEEIIQICISIFKNISGLSSKLDIQKQREEIEKNLKDIPEEELTWKSIKGSKCKKYLINKYVNTLGDILQLNNNQKNELKTLINMGLLLDIINSSNIILKNNEINKIENLNYDTNSGKFILENKKQKKTNRLNKLKYIKDNEYFSPSNKLENLNLHSFSFKEAWNNFIDKYIKGYKNTASLSSSMINEDNSEYS